MPASTTIPTKKRVAVIGAGVSGLRAACVLLGRTEHLEVKVFEATDHIGGRVRQKTLGEEGNGGDLVDEGANWIHGSSDTHAITRIAEELSVPLKDFLHPAHVDSTGKMLTERDSWNIDNKLWENIEYAQEFARLNYDNIPPEVSLYDFMVEKVKLDYPDDPRMQKLALDQCHIWGHYVGDDVRKQSLKHFFMEENCAGENLFVAGTYRKIVNKIAEPVLEAGVISLSSPVTSIATTDHSTNLITYTQNGTTQTYEADAIILTTPLGCLKHKQISFSPPIPSRMAEAIEGMNYGHLEKIYIKFTTPWWDANSKWDHIVFQSPTYASSTNPDFFPMTAFSMSSLPEPVARPTLLFYLYGDLSRRITSLDLDMTPGSKAFNEIYDFLTPYFSKLPGYDPSVVTPVAITRSNWYNDHFTGYGSYTNFLVGNERGADDVVELRKGMPDRNIFMAGEHVAPFVGLGTVTGAYWSGEIAAGRVLEEVVGTDVPKSVQIPREPEDVMVTGRNGKLGYDVEGMGKVLEVLRGKVVVNGKNGEVNGEVNGNGVAH
ncbi:FAD/NAD(P)-binding domain-containing protein [Ascobolus immersus RN42]|uniref:FAD/NAD(P)-binding domain-containing protein n=1 Tax=Ascobolus immersus RN42 TaxID=1160509 RepID=A0A3N4IGN1_ASCIM|nr:FAD/NAD(P)-binding domain-containing protein [Ascobolus immersus RN42]